VENDPRRARRRQVLARLGQWLRREPDDVNLILPFDEVVAALGGAASVPSACRRSGWSPWLARWTTARTSTGGSGPPPPGARAVERLALAQRRGEPLPPSTCTRSATYFVEDGHHRVSIALAWVKVTDAYVTRY
jgi:hypothetical protein